MHLKTILSLLFTFICTELTSQINLNHLSSFLPAWPNGVLSGSAMNVGVSGVNVNLSITKSGGSYGLTNGSSGSQTPTVINSIMNVAGSISSIQVTMDFTNNSQYTDLVYSFSANVTNVSFKIADIDKSTSTSKTYFDQVTVTGSDGSIIYTPTLSKYVSTSAVVVVSGNVAKANNATGVGGNSTSSLTDQSGTIEVDFGSSVINSITIRYNNAPGANTNTAPQAIAIGDITFVRHATLPVKFISFGVTRINSKNQLGWTVSDEVKVKEYRVEKSHDGKNFVRIGSQSPITFDQSVKSYLYVDNDNNNNYPIAYYRICEIDIDGNHSYSIIRKTELMANLVIWVNGKLVKFWFKDSNKDFMLKILDTNGRLVLTKKISELRIPLQIPYFSSLKNIYIIQLYTLGGDVMAKKILL